MGIRSRFARAARLRQFGSNLGRLGAVRRIEGQAFNVVVLPTGTGVTIDGAGQYNLTSQYQFVTVVTDGANWFVVGT